MRKVKRPTQGCYMDLTSATANWCFILTRMSKRPYTRHLRTVHLRVQNEDIFIESFSYLIGRRWFHGLWLLHISDLNICEWWANSYVLPCHSFRETPWQEAGVRCYQLHLHEVGQNLHSVITVAVAGVWDRAKKILKFSLELYKRNL